MQRTTVIIILLSIGFVSNIMSGPIHDAAAEGDTAKVKDLLDQNPAAVNAEDDSRMTPVIFALADHHFKTAQLLVDRGAKIDIQDTNKNTPLIISTENNSLPEVTFLLTNNADPNKKNKDGYTALHIAVRNANRDIIRLLLLFGADVDMPNKNNKTPLKIAGKSFPLYLSLSSQKNQLKLFNFQDMNKLKQEIEDSKKYVQGNIFYQRDHEGDTLLHKAIIYDVGVSLANKKDQFETINSLIQQGAELSVTNRQGLTPYEYAMKESDTSRGEAKTLLIKIANHIKNSMKTDDAEKKTAQALQQLADALTNI